MSTLPFGESDATGRWFYRYDTWENPQTWGTFVWPEGGEITIFTVDGSPLGRARSTSLRATLGITARTALQSLRRHADKGQAILTREDPRGANLLVTEEDWQERG